MKPTQGDWRICDDPTSIQFNHVVDDCLAPCTIAITCPMIHDGDNPPHQWAAEARANARLIAAAPKLLAGCKAALGAFERCDAINWDDLARAIKEAEPDAP